jgi:membrane associated rhomboid family serine protease
VLVVPLGLEDRDVHRVPVVTLALILINALAFAATWAVGAAGASNAEVLRELIEKAFQETPYVTVGPRLARELGREGTAALQEARASWEAGGSAVAPDQRRRAQREFDALVDDYHEALARLPARRFGFVPAQPALLALLTAMFMHAGWLHLLGNMLFLYVSGPYLEEAYGKAIFAAGYLLSGVAATVGHVLADPQSTVPLVGASGAIAGVMGMMLVRLARTKIRFLFLPIVFLPNVRIHLSLPALLVLPLWVLEQLAYAARTPSQGGGVAWWAHVAGFAFGAVFAGAVMALGLEERWLGRSESADEGRRALDRAAVARERGDFEKARAALRGARTGEPDASDLVAETYELALAEQDTAEVARALARLLDVLPRRGATDVALALVDDGRWAEVPDPPARLYFAVASFLDRQGQPDRALALYDEVLRAAPRDAFALRAALRKGDLQTTRGDTEAARRTLEGTRTHPALDDRGRLALESALARLPPRSGA